MCVLLPLWGLFGACWVLNYLKIFKAAMYKFRQSAGYLSKSGSVGSNLIHIPANTWGLCKTRGHKDLRIKKSPNSKNHNYKINIVTKN